MSSNPITSAAHINAAAYAIRNLVSEYETLDGRMTLPAAGRRAFAMEQLCAVTFSTVTDDLDPYGMDDLNDQLAKETLHWSSFVTELVVTAMLDFRQKAKEHSHSADSYRDRLRALLLEMWLLALEELQAGEEADQEPGDVGDAGAGDAGEWGSLAA